MHTNKWLAGWLRVWWLKRKKGGSGVRVSAVDTLRTPPLLSASGRPGLCLRQRRRPLVLGVNWTSQWARRGVAELRLQRRGLRLPTSVRTALGWVRGFSNLNSVHGVGLGLGLGHVRGVGLLRLCSVADRALLQMLTLHWGRQRRKVLSGVFTEGYKRPLLSPERVYFWNEGLLFLQCNRRRFHPWEDSLEKGMATHSSTLA